MYSLKKLAGQTAVYGLSSIIGRFLNYLLTPLYTYQFIARDYGVVTEMYAYVAFLVVMLTYGMETAYFRFASKSSHPLIIYNNTLFTILLTSVGFIAICMLWVDQISGFIEYPDNPEFVIWFGLIVGLDAISAIPLARLRQENKAGRFAWINLSSIGVNILLNLFFIGYCKVEYDQGRSNWLIANLYNPDLGVGYIFIVNLVSSGFKCLLLSPYILKLSFNIDRKLISNMLVYALPLLVAGLAGIANESLDRILMKYILIDMVGKSETMTQIGIYGACYKVSILITLFVQAYRYAAEPFFFSQSGEKDAPDAYARMMKYFVIVCLFIFLGLMLNIDTVMLFVGEEYRQGAKVVPILLLANIFLGIYYNLSVWYKLTDKTMYGAYIAIIGALVTVSGNILLIPHLGYMGSAWTTLLCYGIMVLISYVMQRRHYPVPYQIPRMLGYFVFTIGIYVATSSIDYGNSTIRIGVNNSILLALAALIYVLERPKKIII